MTKVEQQLKELANQEQKLQSQLKKQRANKQFKCGCGKMHKIRNCVAIQTHWYTPPRGCTGGDYWNEGEMQIICPDTDIKNRLLFDNYDVPWSERNNYAYNAGSQFSRIYMLLFKEVIQDYEEDKRSWYNNFYIDRNHVKFGLHVEGRDYLKWSKKGK